MRGLKGPNFWVMEQQAGSSGWEIVSAAVEDDDAALAAMRAPSFDPAATAVLSTGSAELDVALEAAPANAVETAVKPETSRTASS